MSLKMILILLFISAFNFCLCRDICTQFGVLRQIDSFLISQKESKPVVFDITNLQNINKQLELSVPLFQNNLKNYLKPNGPAVETRDLIKFNENKNFIKITGTLKNIAKECEKINASLFTPKSLAESEKAAAILKKLSIAKIPINVKSNRGYLETLDGSSLSPALTEDDSILKSWVSSFPLLGQETIYTGLPNSDVTAFCEKTNNPWDHAGPSKDKWMELGKLLLKTTPTLLNTVNKISENFVSKTPDSKIAPASAPASTRYPIPASLINVLDSVNKWSSPQEWEKTQITDLNTFKNLITDIGKVSSLFTASTRANKFAKKPVPALGFQIDPATLPSSLAIDPDSILLDNSIFYPRKYLDTSGDVVPELVEGPVVIKHAEKSDKIEIYEFLPLLFGDYRLEAVFLIRGSSHRELAHSAGPLPPSGIRCAEREGSRICDGYTKKLVQKSTYVDPAICLNAIMGLDSSADSIRKCPVSDIANSNPVGFRIDCSDHFNLVIDSKQPLFITPVCDGQDGESFMANHFPLFMNTDCEVRAKYERDPSQILIIPQVEADAESKYEAYTDMTLITPFENTIVALKKELSLLDKLIDLPNNSVTILVSIVAVVFLTTLFIFITLLVFCIGPKRTLKFISKRCSCCTDCSNCCDCFKKYKNSKLNCCNKQKENFEIKTKKKKKYKFKKPDCCCQAESDSESGPTSAGQTPGPSRPPGFHSSLPSELNRIGTQLLNFVQNTPSAPLGNEIEMAPLNKNLKNINQLR